MPSGTIRFTVDNQKILRSLGNGIFCSASIRQPFAGGHTQGSIYAHVAERGDAAGGRRPQAEEETGHGQVRLRAGSSVAFRRCLGSVSGLVVLRMLLERSQHIRKHE